MADVERHAGLSIPAGVFAFEKVVKKSLLQCLAVVAVEMGEVSVAVHLKPFLSRARTQPALEIAARVEPHAAPITGRQQRRFEFFTRGGTHPVVIVERPTRISFPP